MTNSGITKPLGFKAGGIHCGIRKNQTKKDLALIFSDVSCTCAAVYTSNLVKGAPLTVTKEHLSDGKARAIIINSGNANTCNADGIEKAKKMCKLTADSLNINITDVLVASTGVIGQTLNIEPIENNINKLTENLSYNGSNDAAHAIMTTDTVFKEAFADFLLNDKKCTIGGISKGSGMIRPDMATMLCFLTTDTAISQKCLSLALKNASDNTFNMLSIDGDTSTNDMVIIMANGIAGNKLITDENSAEFKLFTEKLTEVCISLARMMAKDGEGATKLIECHVFNAKSPDDAKKCAKSVICSNLFKAAMFGKDANWGRILCALGYSNADITIDKIDVNISSKAGEINVCKNGTGVLFDEDKAKIILSEDEVIIKVFLNDGKFNSIALGCDLTYDYVKINGDYRT